MTSPFENFQELKPAPVEEMEQWISIGLLQELQNIGRTYRIILFFGGQNPELFKLGLPDPFS
jgi:hypothetical protein